MPWLTLQQAVDHLRLDDASMSPNLALYVAAACDSASQFLNRPVYETQQALDAAQQAAAVAGEVWNANSMVANDTLRAAALLILGNLHEHREDVVEGSAAALPMGSQWLLQPYRVGMGV